MAAFGSWRATDSLRQLGLELNEQLHEHSSAFVDSECHFIKREAQWQNGLRFAEHGRDGCVTAPTSAANVFDRIIELNDPG